jgi:hypothetical protein
MAVHAGGKIRYQDGLGSALGLPSKAYKPQCRYPLGFVENPTGHPRDIAQNDLKREIGSGSVLPYTFLMNIKL